MFSKPCSAFLVAIAVALAVGWWVAGPLVYKIALGLNETAFPAGEQLQHLSTRLAPGYARASAGLALLAITSLAVGTAAFLLIRAVKRSQVASIDPSRRRFLTGLGLGTATALVSTALVGGFGLARGWLGLGRGGRGWRPVFAQIFSNDVVETHPEWKEAWKGAEFALIAVWGAPSGRYRTSCSVPRPLAVKRASGSVGSRSSGA